MCGELRVVTRDEAAASQSADALVPSIAQGEEAMIVNAIAASGGT